MTRKNHTNGRNKRLIMGIMLILSSGLAFGLMLVFPFLPLDNKTKVFGSSASFIAMEVLFWGGSLLTGKELIGRYRHKLNPRNWFRRSRNKAAIPEDAADKL